MMSVTLREDKNFYVVERFCSSTTMERKIILAFPWQQSRVFIFDSHM
jgi:hypothetical protein